MTGFLWFGLLAAAGYIGAASALVERVLTSPRADAAVYTPLAAELESAMAALTSVAAEYDVGERGPDLSARLLFIRKSLRTALQRVAPGAMTAVGGIAFITGPGVAYLGSVLQTFSYHPPLIGETQRSLFDYHRGSRSGSPDTPGAVSSVHLTGDGRNASVAFPTSVTSPTVGGAHTGVGAASGINGASTAERYCPGADLGPRPRDGGP